METTPSSFVSIGSYTVVSSSSSEEAYDLLQDALDGLAVVQAQTSQNSQTLEQYIDDSLDELN